MVVVSSNPAQDRRTRCDISINFRQVDDFLRVVRFPTPIKLSRYNWNICGVKYHKTKPNHDALTIKINKDKRDKNNVKKETNNINKF